MRLRTGLEVAAPAALVWDELTDLTAWPEWGPSVRAARLDDGGRRLHAGGTGSVQTALGVWLPFRVEDWHEDSVLSWSWRVAGVPATDHRVRPLGPDRCRVEIGVPWWAPAYLGVTSLALARIGYRVESGRR